MALPKAFYGIIPARYASTRFPGKPLAPILGKPMFWHVYTQAIVCPYFEKVVLATDDERIQAAALHYNIPVVMTRTEHASGTDRVYEAAQQLSISENNVVINIQGDEPLLDPDMLSLLCEAFKDDETQAATLATRINHHSAQDPNTVKIVLNTRNEALYFSRAPIPFPRDSKSHPHYFSHIGIYAFRMKALETFVSLPQSRLEQIEKLEQLRLLENSVSIRVVETNIVTIGVDTPEDITRVETILKRI